MQSIKVMLFAGRCFPEAVRSKEHVGSLSDSFGLHDKSLDLVDILYPILFNATAHIDAENP